MPDTELNKMDVVISGPEGLQRILGEEKGGNER